MIVFDEWVFPPNEKHLQQWMTQQQQKRHGRLCYQAHKYDLAMQHVTNKGCAIDIGAHVGLLSFLMAMDFETVEAFEPMALHAKCWRQNIRYANCVLHECALGEKEGSVAVETRTKDSSGDSGVTGGGDIPMITLDSLSFDNVGFIKIDCEGYELAVLKGAQETLLRCKPVVMVEQKGNMAEKYGFKKLGAVKYMESLGAHLVSEISGDYILKWV